MNNLSWIKSLYLYEEAEAHGNKEKFVIAFVSLIIGGVLSSKKHSLWPIGLCLFAIFLTYFLSPSHPIFRTIRYALFVLFQTLNLVILSFLFYFVITPIGLLKRFSNKSDSFYKNKSKKTIEDATQMSLEFERLF